jgi:hypothetical protein
LLSVRLQQSIKHQHPSPRYQQSMYQHHHLLHPIKVNITEKKAFTIHLPLFRLLASDHHTHSKHLITLISIGLPTKSRCLHQLLSPTAMQWFSHNNRPVDDRPMHTHLFIISTSTTVIDCDHPQRTLPSSSNARLWHLSAHIDGVHDCFTSNHIHSNGPPEDHTNAHHT